MINTRNYYLYSILILSLFVFFSLLEPYLWFDESGQFFMSLGLNHFSPPNTFPGSFSEVIKNNNNYNLDPGGFTVLLYIWMKLSTNYIWIRLLPYLFFLLSIFLLVDISDKLCEFKNKWIFGLVIFLIPQLVFRSLEIRAYTMEFLSILISIHLVTNIKNMSKTHVFMISILSSILITSRYSSIVTFGVVTLITIIEIIISSKNKLDKLKTIYVLSTPLMTSVTLIYFFILKNQNPNLSKVSYSPYLDDNPFLLFQDYNFIHILCLFMLIFILLFDRKLLRNLKLLIYTSIFVNLTFIILSLSGIYPYDPFDERNLGVFVFTFLPLIYWIINRLNSKIQWINNSLYSISFLIIYMIVFSLTLKDNWRKNNIHTDMINYQFPKESLVIVESHLKPSIKHLFEYTSYNYGLVYDDFIFLERDLIFEDTVINKSKNYFLMTNREIINPKFKKIGRDLYKIHE